MRFRTLVLIVAIAAMSFGGSFTCHASSNDDDHYHKPPPPPK